MRYHDLVVIAEVFDSCSTDVGELSDELSDIKLCE